MLAININSPYDTQEFLKNRFKKERLFLKLTQKTLSQKSGVTLGSIKRFESSGEISLGSLLRIAIILDLLDDFLNIGQKEPTSIKEMIKREKLPKRGSR